VYIFMLLVLHVVIFAFVLRRSYVRSSGGGRRRSNVSILYYSFSDLSLASCSSLVSHILHSAYLGMSLSSSSAILKSSSTCPPPMTSSILFTCVRSKSACYY
jgi:hypothetical protein